MNDTTTSGPAGNPQDAAVEQPRAAAETTQNQAQPQAVTEAPQPQAAQGGPAEEAAQGNGAQPSPTVGDHIPPEALQRAGARAQAPDLDVVMRIPVTLQAVLGQARMSIARLMKLGPGSVVPLDHKVGDPVDVVVNGRLVARGEVVLLEGESERFGITLTEIIGPGTGMC